MRKNRATRLANKVGSVEKLFMLLAPLKAAADKAEGRDKLPTRRRVETHHAAIAILEAREKAEGPKPKPKPKKAKAAPKPEAPRTSVASAIFGVPVKKTKTKKP